jgi:hypothetical protein
VNDWNFEAFREITRVVRGSSIDRIGCESNLIVRDYVQRTAHAISAKSGHVERFRNDTFARERGISMNHDGNYDSFVAFRSVGFERLTRARDSLQYRIRKFEVTRIGNQ